MEDYGNGDHKYDDGDDIGDVVDDDDIWDVIY